MEIILDIVTIGVLLSMQLSYASLPGNIIGPHEVCNREHYNVTCGAGEVIVIHSARYGRMEVGRCVKRDLGYLGCAVDVTSHLHGKCSGRERCEMKIPDDTMYETQPCPEDTTSYLKVEHKCIKVASSSGAACHHRKPLELTGTSGVLSTYIAEHHGFGTHSCPWHISVRPGQRINITLHAFNGKLPTEVRNSDICYEIATITEQKEEKDVLACLPEKAPRQIYTSRGSSITVSIPKRSPLNECCSFLLQYNVIGCPEINAPAPAWTHVTDDTAMIKCNDTGETWYLTCRNGKWLGKFGSCGETMIEETWTMQQIFPFDGFPYGILAAVAIGVALGVFLGGVLLAFIVMKSRRKNSQMRQNGKLPDYSCHGERVLATDGQWTDMQQIADQPDDYTLEKVHVPIGHNCHTVEHLYVDKHLPSLDHSPSRDGANGSGGGCAIHMYETTHPGVKLPSSSGDVQ